MSIEKMKVAVVGCGSISSVYLDSIRKHFSILDVVACTDLDLARRDACAEKYGIRGLTFDEILADPEIEMVINLTTPAAHYPITKQALLAGKHVFSEKMIAVTLEEGKELCALADEKGLRLGVAPDTFLGGAIQTARYVMETGLIGEPLSFVASLNRDYGIFGELLPHLRMKGAGIAFDMGGYYLTALANFFGPAESVAAFSRCYNPERVDRRVTNRTFGEPYTLETENVVTASLRYKNGVLGTFHMNSDSILDETVLFEIYGTDGILYVGDPNMFDSKISVKKTKGETFEFPYTHGYTEQSRGIGAAEMAWAIRGNRPHRASKEMAYHVFEMLHGILRAAKEEQIVRLESTFEQPKALPAGFIGNGFWGPTEESALV
ncbi:Gfo/Idh/MocA family protein [Yeguia hominis]|uniref:Gfo/Idh/MocA family oxidoreductase n=1 Tax=Yeguia hominis TaxID=2763662 RepID=A0A926HQN5_9FIRM|nr:Gfo/Idh/MocA family oxidoreductase [Yeguia hominis]MBC8532924.1 Gfo/Idh/MocA family oxidoreductase [Yeguia hominis]